MAQVLDIASQPGLARIAESVALGKGFQFHLLVTADTGLFFHAVAAIQETASLRLGKPVREIVLDPYSGSNARITREGLSRGILDRILHPPEFQPDEVCLVALHACAAVKDDEAAWRWLFRRMNERRNTLAARLRATLVLGVASSLETALAHEAPDFWSIRGNVAVLTANPSAEKGMASFRDLTQRELEQDAPLPRLPGETLEADLDNARDQVCARPGDASAIRVLCNALAQWGEYRRSVGDSRGALLAYEETARMAERLAQAEPDRADYQRDLSVSYNKMGDLYRALGRGEEAREAYLKALGIRERLAQAEPDRADYRRDLSVSYNKMGDLYRALGRGEEAREAYLKDLGIAERLAQAEPDRADYRRDLSVSYNKMGDLYRALGRGEEAREAYLKDLGIAERLAQAEPDRADYRRDLSVSYNNMGDLYRALGRGEEAREAYLKALGIAERLAQAEPDRADYRRDLSVSYNNMGDLYRALGRGEEAREAYLKALGIRERLAQAEPDRADCQVDLAVSLFKVGTEGDTTVREPLERALTILLALQREGRLDPEHEPKIAALRERLHATEVR